MNHDEAEMRLAVYGSLAPGRVNHHLLANIDGNWSLGFVTGKLMNAGWGAALGYPGLVLHTDGDSIEVHVLESPHLPLHWARLDDFEGENYRRVTTKVHTDKGVIDASIYILNT